MKWKLLKTRTLIQTHFGQMNNQIYLNNSRFSKIKVYLTNNNIAKPKVKIKYRKKKGKEFNFPIK